MPTRYYHHIAQKSQRVVKEMKDGEISDLGSTEDAGRMCTLGLYQQHQKIKTV